MALTGEEELPGSSGFSLNSSSSFGHVYLCNFFSPFIFFHFYLSHFSPPSSMELPLSILLLSISHTLSLMDRIQPAKPSHRHTYRCQVRLHDGNENFNVNVNDDYSSLLRLHDAEDNCDDVDDKLPTRFLEI